MKPLTVHVEEKWGHWNEVNLELREPEKWGNYSRTSTWEVYQDGEYLGKIERTQGHVERVPIAPRSRIGKDLRPRTVWRFSMVGADHPGGFTPGLYYDSRNEVLGRLLGVTRLDIHLPGRKPRWVRCHLCEENS